LNHILPVGKVGDQGVVAAAVAAANTIVVVDAAAVAQYKSIDAISPREGVDFAAPRIAAGEIDARQNVVTRSTR
jgi:hypothetical protein